MLKIVPITAFKDNYIWAGVQEEQGRVFVVDPGQASPVFDFLSRSKLSLTEILITHKHADHTGGIAELLAVYPQVKVYSHPLEKVAMATHFVQHNDTVNIEENLLSFRVLHIPGHTLGHVAYYANHLLFTGDTLFGGGCGRVFEGTAEQMFASLNRLKNLPEDTLVYCGHEYTLANLKFARQVEPQNEDIVERMKNTEHLLLNKQSSLPSTIALEKRTNPFFRCEQQGVIASVEARVNRKLENVVEVFHELREWKNSF